MTVRHFVGPHGARFMWAEPLPGWLEKQLAAGEVTERKPEEPKPEKQAKKNDEEG